MLNGQLNDFLLNLPSCLALGHFHYPSEILHGLTNLNDEVKIRIIATFIHCLP